MPLTVIVHISNEDAFLAEVDAMPKPTDSVLIISNPRKRDGKPLTMIDQEADTLVYPWSRVTFLEILSERASRDELVEFFRDE